MPKMESDGIDSLVSSFEAMYRDTNKLQDAILDDGASIIKTQVERELFQSGHSDTGELLASIKIKKKKAADGTMSRVIRPMGRDSKNVSNGYKGFLVNYGTSKMPGDRFWERAEKTAEPELQKAANTEVNLYLKQKGLI